MTKPLYRFHLITVHRNGTERLRRFLQSAAAAFDISRDAITVVDNHSTDDSVDVLSKEFSGVRFIRNGHNMGYAYACNQGMAQAESEFILICNNDLVLPDTLLQRLEEDFAKHPSAGMIGVQLVSTDGRHSTSAGQSPTLLAELEISRPKRFAPVDEVTAVESLLGACMAVRASALATAGPLDTQFFFYFEDAEWCIRIRKSGWQILFDKRLEVTHVGGASTVALFPGARIEYHRSRMYFWKKVFPRYHLLLGFWITLKMVLSSCLYLVILTVLLGQSRNYRWRLKNHLATLAWLALGRPDHWGLPDKPLQQKKNS